MSDISNSSTGGPLVPEGPDLPLDNVQDRVLSQLVRGITGLPPGTVVPRWQPKPPDQLARDIDWCAIGVTEEVPYDTPSQQHHPDGPGYTILRSTSRLEVLASFYGPRSRGLARLLVDGLWIAQNREILSANGMTLMRTGTLRSMPALVNTENRWRCDAPLTLTQTIERVYDIRNVLQTTGRLRATGGRNSTTTPMDTPLASPASRP